MLIGAIAASSSAAGQASAAPAPQVPAAPAAPQTLPGGATQVQETFGDWRVTCAQPNGTKLCVLTQQLSDKASGQRMLGVELKAVTPDKAEGSLVLPFGLAVDKPITMQIDDAGATISTHVRTCLPVGCVASLSFDAATIAALRKGTALNVKAVADGGADASFKLSLTGFGGGLDRTAALSK